MLTGRKPGRRPKADATVWGINGAAGGPAPSLSVLCSMAHGFGPSIVFAAARSLLLIPAAWVVGVAKEDGDPV
jgi:hypothetical protein